MTDLRSDWEDGGDWSGGDSAEADQPDALAELATAAEGLLVMSESDHPLEPFRWSAADPITPETLLAYLQLPIDTPIETRSLEAFFDPLAQDREWFDDEQRVIATRFAALRDLIADRLRDVTVYQVGTTRITALIIGRDPSDEFVGLRTSLIET
ncbi:MAG: sugar-non-specific nuclease inhibitor NuiA-like protein [Oscillochloris sp.]|nr:sugar-non-specific nuclease inhibitor NuiA-like protein [Oscillochloris sp.]